MMQDSGSFRLIVRRGPQPNQSHELNKDIVTLGRDITNDIVINDPEVSRHHMRLTRGGGGFTIEDLGSTNGTFINGQRLTGARPLRPGDMVGLGETVTLAYEAEGVVAATGSTEDAPQPFGGTVAAPMQRSYAPDPGQMQPPTPAQRPYAPPQQQQQPSSYSYTPPPAGAGQGGLGGQQPYGGYNNPASPAPQAPPPVAPEFGGEYDPYAVREEPRNTTRLVLIGCAGLSLVCCCATTLGLVFVDQLCLWDRIPVVYDVLRALGYTVAC